RRLYPEHVWQSAGVMPLYELQPLSARVITEAGGSAEGFSGQDVHDLDLSEFDHVILIGETARNHSGPLPEGVGQHIWYIFDPYNAIGTDEERLEIYREVREELLSHLAELAGELGLEKASAG
ncbi:MAG: hypothetical protein R3F46_16565, partial [bacterium]